jgi:hypothetical protein
VLTADGEPIAEHEWRNDFLAVLEWAPGIDRPLAVGGPRAALRPAPRRGPGCAAVVEIRLSAEPGRGLKGRLVAAAGAGHDAPVWRRTEPGLDRETVDNIIRKLMSIDDKLTRLVDELLEDDGEEKADT